MNAEGCVGALRTEVSLSGHLLSRHAGATHPSFDLIFVKLEVSAYPTPVDFSLGVRCLFTSPQ
jgi:hypothetical protein